MFLRSRHLVLIKHNLLRKADDYDLILQDTSFWLMVKDILRSSISALARKNPHYGSEFVIRSARLALIVLDRCAKVLHHHFVDSVSLIQAIFKVIFILHYSSNGINKNTQRRNSAWGRTWVEWCWHMVPYYGQVPDNMLSIFLDFLANSYCVN